MPIIRRHATQMHRLVNAIPPRPSCVFPASAKKPLGAWFAKDANGGPEAKTRECINAPDVSLAFYMLYGEYVLAEYMIVQLHERHSSCPEGGWASQCLVLAY